MTLPDREAPRTARTIVPQQGLKMVMPYMDENEDTVVPVQPVVEPYPIKESNVDLPELTGQCQYFASVPGHGSTTRRKDVALSYFPLD